MIAIMGTKLLDVLRALPNRIEEVRLRARVFRRGEAVSALYLVEHGELCLQRDGVDGNTLVLERAGDGQLLAEASLHASRYHCDAVATAPTQARRIEREAVLERFRTDPRFAELWCQGLAEEVRDTRFHNELLRLRTVRARVDAWLDWHGDSLPPRGGRQALAHELGVSPEALYRELARRTRTR